MKTIKVVKKDLLNHLKVNREIHKIEFEKAMNGYRSALIIAFEKLLEQAKQLEDTAHGVYLDRPKSYLDSYDSAICQLEWTTDTEIELDQNEFKQLVQDEWNWKQGFTAMAATYG